MESQAQPQKSYVEVVLSPSEIETGAIEGVRRCIQGIAKNRKPAYGAGRDKDWQLNIEGRLGEIAVAKFIGVYSCGTGKFRGADVGKNIEVRTRSSHTYGVVPADLILHPDDPGDRPFYLVTGRNGSYRIHGWIRGRDGKLPGYWKDPAGGRAAFFVPPDVLLDPNVRPDD